LTDCAAIALALFDEWEKRDYDAVMGHFADGALVRDHPRNITLTAPPEIRAWMESWATACEDSTAGAKATVSSSDSAVIEGIYAGTNTGPLGPLPASGRTVSMPFAIVIGFDGAGKVTTYDVYYDQYTLLSQLGHVPALA
jgi:steroid delta-isomerase-like uncharacterized protein